MRVKTDQELRAELEHLMEKDLDEHFSEILEMGIFFKENAKQYIAQLRANGHLKKAHEHEQEMTKMEEAHEKQCKKMKEEYFQKFLRRHRDAECTMAEMEKLTQDTVAELENFTKESIERMEKIVPQE
jgi:hypothetical protein